MEKILFLHHSAGKKIWLGNTNKYLNKLTGRNDVQDHFKTFNKQNNTNYTITELTFPKTNPYGWKNYPYDYYNIWVKNAGKKPFMEEPTLEILTEEYNVIVFKHCFPVSKIADDTGIGDIDSEEKRIENYKLQYNALKKKMYEFPGTRFIIWTPSVHRSDMITKAEALRTFEFYKWIIEEWDEKGDNIFIWDFYGYETEGGHYLLDKYSEGQGNSHPNMEFSARIAPLFCKFVIDVINSVVQ